MYTNQNKFNINFKNVFLIKRVFVLQRVIEFKCIKMHIFKLSNVHFNTYFASVDCINAFVFMRFLVYELTSTNFMLYGYPT